MAITVGTDSPDGAIALAAAAGGYGFRLVRLFRSDNRSIEHRVQIVGALRTIADSSNHALAA